VQEALLVFAENSLGLEGCQPCGTLSQCPCKATLGTVSIVHLGVAHGAGSKTVSNQAPISRHKGP
jgi:hypothetical protein